MTGILLLILGCGKKSAPVESAKPVEPVVEAPVVEEPVVEEPVVEEPMEPTPEPNADFNTTITFSDGSTKTGHVVRVERSSDFYGMTEWFDKESRLTIFAESGSTAKDLSWTEIKSVSVVPNKSGISCVYESEWNPWLYVCTNKTNSSLIDVNGKKWGLDSKNKWRFTFDDETTTEFWIQNIRATQQDTVEIELGMEAYENAELYGQLQETLQSLVYVKSVSIQ
jgi:hypothetical protein